MSVPWGLALFLAGLLSSLYLLLLKGDEEWYYPLFAAAVILWAAPLAVRAALSAIAPYAPAPLYVYGVSDVDPSRWAEEARAVYEAAEAAAEAAARALEAVSVAATAALTAMFVASALAAPAAAGTSLLWLAYAAWRYVDPAIEIAGSAYSAAAGIYMLFHTLYLLASWASSWFGPLAWLGLLLMLFKRARALGALLTAAALFLYVSAAAGAYLASAGFAVVQWANATASWAGEAPKGSGTLSLLLVEGRGVALLRYNNTFSYGRLAAELGSVWRATGLGAFPQGGLAGALAENATDWAAAAPGAPAVLYIGNKSWAGLGEPRPYAVFDWLDWPIRISPAGWCFGEPGTPPNVTIAGLPAAVWLSRVRAAECNLTSSAFAWWIADAEPPRFWRYLEAPFEVYVTYGNKTLQSGRELGAAGIWGWLAPPLNETCTAGGDPAGCRAADLSTSPGRYAYDVGTGAAIYAPPPLRPLEDRFAFSVPNASRPALAGEVKLWSWRETCRWCARWANGTCAEWRESTREARQTADVKKIDREAEYPLAVVVYGRPWVPEDPERLVLNVTYVERIWDVSVRTEYGPWDNGVPPPDASCWTWGKAVYEVLRFWRVGSASSYVYAFYWLGGASVALNYSLYSLPDAYPDAPASVNGTPAVNYLEGAEYGQICRAFLLPAEEPYWRAVPVAAANLTEINREAFFALLAAANYSAALSAPPNVSRLAEPRPFYPMPFAAPLGYSVGNLLAVCVRFDWRGYGNAAGVLSLEPGRAVWLAGYGVGSSGAGERALARYAEIWTWVLSSPPPPPPASLMATWPVPWNGSASLPYKPAAAPPIPPPDRRWGVPLWSAGLLAYVPKAFGELLGRIWAAAFLAFLAPIAVFEALAAVLGFPSPARLLYYLANHVVGDLTYLMGIRVTLRSRLAARLAKIFGGYARSASARLARRVSLRGSRKAGDRPRELRGWDEELLRRLEAKLAAAGRKAAVAASAAAAAAKAVAKYAEADALGLLRAAFPRLDAALDSWLAETARSRPALYWLLAGRLDVEPRWAVHLSPVHLRRMLLEGRISREQYEEALAAREIALAKRAAVWLASGAPAEAARAWAKAVEESARALRALGAELARDWGAWVEERARRMAASGRRAGEAYGEALGEAERRLEELIKAVYSPLEAVRGDAFAQLVAAVKAALPEDLAAGLEARSPRELARALLGVGEGPGGGIRLDPALRVKLLEAFPILEAAWRERWAPAPFPETSEALALAEARARLPSLMAVSAARALALGAARPEDLAKRFGSVDLPGLLSRLGAEERAVEVLRKALRAAERGDGEALREVLEETFRYVREFGESLAWARAEGPVYLVERPEARELRRAFEAALRTAAERGGAAAEEEFREEVERIAAAYAERGGGDAAEEARRLGRRLAKLLEGLGPVAAPRGAGEDLRGFLRSPRLDADLASLRLSAASIGARDVVRLLDAAAEAARLLDLHGRRRYLSPLHYALLRAPAAAHVAAALGTDLAARAYRRSPALRNFGREVREALAYVGAAPRGRGGPRILESPPARSYPEEVARLVREWSPEGIAEALSRYYRGPGSRDLAAAELLALAGRAAALEKAADELERRGGAAGGLLALALRARAALEDAEIAERAAGGRAEEERRRYRELVRKLEEAVSSAGPEALRAVELYTGAEIPAGGAVRRLLALAAPEVAARWAGGDLARALEAYRTYRRLEKFLAGRRPGGEPPISPAPLGAPPPSRVEDAVVAGIRRWAESAYRQIEESLAAVGVGPPRGPASGFPRLPANVLMWLRERGLLGGAWEAAWRLREAVGRFMGEAAAAAGFSPRAKLELEAVAREWAGSPGLKKYLAARLFEVLRSVEPSRYRDAALYRALPEGLRSAAGEALGDVESALLEEGYYDRALAPVYKALYYEGARAHPRSVAAKALEELRRLGPPRGGEEAFGRAEEALEELAGSGLDDPGLLEKARRAGDALAEALSYVVEARWAGGNDAASLLKAASGLARWTGGEARRELLAEALYRSVGRHVERAAGAYAEALEAGRLPEPSGMALVFVARSRAAASFLARRLQVEAALGVDERGRPAVYYLAYHPAMRGFVEALKAYALGKAAEGGLSAGSLGPAPPELLFSLRGFGSAKRAGEAVELRAADPARRLEELAARAASEMAEGRTPLLEGEAAGFAAGMHTALLASRLSGEYSRFLSAYLGGAEAVPHGGLARAFLGWLAAGRLWEEAVARYRSGNREALWGWAHYGGEIGDGMALRLAGEADASLLPALKGWLAWLAGEALAPPPTKRAFGAAVRLYEEASGRRGVTREAEERLKRLDLPEGLRDALSRPAEGAPRSPELPKPGPGLVPEGLSGAAASAYLASLYGPEEARGLGEAVRAAVEEELGRGGEALRRVGGRALEEAWSRAAEAALRAVERASGSPEALAYLELALGLAGKAPEGLSPAASDAAKALAEAYEEAERAGRELGAARLARERALEVASAAARSALEAYLKAAEASALVEGALSRAGWEALLALRRSEPDIAAAVLLAERGRVEEAVRRVKEAASRIYEAAREALERAGIALERLYELLVEAVARVVAWVDEHRAWLLLAAAAAAGVITWAFAHDVLGSVQLGKLAFAIGIAPLFAREAPARPVRVRREVAEAWIERGEPSLRRNAELYEAVKGKRAVPEDLRSLGGAERAAAVLAAHVFRKAAEAYLKEGLERAEVVFRLELNAVREGLEEIEKETGGGFVQRVLRQLEVDEERAAALAYGDRNAVRRIEGATAAEKALAALRALEGGGAYARAAAGALHMRRLVEFLETKPGTAYRRCYEEPREEGMFKVDIVEKVKLGTRLAPGFAEEELQKELERAVAEAAGEEDAERRVEEVLRSNLAGVEKAPGDNTPALAGLLATDLTFDKSRSVVLATDHLGMAELFVKVVGLDRFYVSDFAETRQGERPRMTLRAEPPRELFRQYGRVLRWLAEEGGFNKVEEIVREGAEALKEKATGEGKKELEHVDPQRVAAEVVEALRRLVPAAEPLSGVEPDWAKVAEKIASKNRSLTRYFLSWLSAYLWAEEGDKKAVADFLTAAIMGDGSIQTGEVTLVVGRFSTKRKKDGTGKKGAGEAKAKEDVETITHIHKAALALGVLAKAGHAPEKVYAKARGESRWFEPAWSVEEAGRFLSNASLHMYAPELAGGSDEIRIKYSKALEIVGVEARIEDFATEGKRPRARLVVRLGGVAAEFSIRLGKNNMVELRFNTTDREEAERRAALLRAVGVRAEVKKEGGRDVWYIDVATNALAAEPVHETVRKAVAEFLRQCRDAGAIGDDTYRRLAAKFERGVPEWGDVRFSVWLGKGGDVEVVYQPSDPQSFRKAVELLRGLGLRDRCEGEWCSIHFTAREPRGGEKGFVRITADGLRYIGWLVLHGEGEAKERAQQLKEMLLKEAEAKGVEARKRLEQYFREGEVRGAVRPPFEKEVEVEGKRLRIRVEEVEAWKEKSEKKEHLVVRVRAVVEDGRGVAVEKEARFFKRSHDGAIQGYINIHGDKDECEADYMRIAALLKALGVERWAREERQILLTGGALDSLMRLEPVCRALGICRKA